MGITNVRKQGVDCVYDMPIKNCSVQQELAEFKVAFDEADALKQKYIVKHNVLYYEHENLKELVREYVDAVDNMYKDYDSWYIVHTRVKQAVTLANDSKEED